jgi:hypothetical protein
MPGRPGTADSGVGDRGREAALMRHVAGRGDRVGVVEHEQDFHERDPSKQYWLLLQRLHMERLIVKRLDMLGT